MINSWQVKEFGSEFPLEIAEGSPVRDGNRVFVRSGRDAIRLVATALKAQGCTNALLPCYCCESMERPFLDAGVQVCYYSVDKNLKANLNDIYEKLQRNKRSMLLYMNYYGCETISENELVTLKNNSNSTLIKDATHDWLDYVFESRSDLDNFTVVSLRKWAGLPEGGLVFSKSQHLEPVSVIDGSFEVNRTTAMRLKRDYLESANNELKKTYLKLLGECSDLLDSLRNTSGMGTLSRTLFSGVNWEDVASKRRENAQVLAEELHKAGIQCIHREGTAPLWVPFLPRCNRDEFQKRLSARNLYCPYLWPLPQNARGCSSYIDSFVDNMLCLPCDQRYDASDMKEIAEILKDEISA